MRNPEYEHTAPPKLAIFRLRDVCVRVQGDLKNYLQTAAIEPVVRIRTTFNWLRKRGIDVCLLSDFDRSGTELLLARLGWEVGPDALIRAVLPDYRSFDDPLRAVHEQLGLEHFDRTVVVADLPALLRQAYNLGCYLVVGVCSGKHPYHTLAPTPHHELLDYTLQLPRLLERRSPALRRTAPLPPERGPVSPPLLWLGLDHYRYGRW